MLKLFASQRNTAMLLRARLPAAVSSNLSNTRDCGRTVSHDSSADQPIQHNPPATLTSVGRFHVMSLISKQGDSLLEIVNNVGDNGPSFKCTGMYDEAASLLNIKDSTQFPTPSVSLFMTLRETPYYLSLKDGNVEARPITDGRNGMTIRERFVHLIHGSYSMFESVAHRDFFLGSDKNGSLHLINVHDKRFPDPRALFLMHSKLITPRP